MTGEPGRGGGGGGREDEHGRSGAEGGEELFGDGAGGWRDEERSERRVERCAGVRCLRGACAQGCGLVTMGTHEEARAAIEGLDSRFCWEGMDSPMVVKWMDAALQRRRREQHLANMLQGLSPSLGGPGESSGARVWGGSGRGRQHLASVLQGLSPSLGGPW